MFRGATSLTLDVKGRLAMPSRYRDRVFAQCGGQLVMTVDRDHCLLLYPTPEWEQIEAKLVRLPSFNKTARKLQRLLLGHATEVELDAAGRFLVPPVLREFASIDKHVMFIGQGNKFELWDEARWTTQRDEWLVEAEGELEHMPTDLESLSL